MGEKSVWTPDAVNRLIIAVTGCCCLLIVVAGCVVLIAYFGVDPGKVGDIAAGGSASGMVAFAMIIFFILKTTLKGGERKSGH